MKGVYCLIMKVKKNIPIKIGALGKINFKKGNYVYVGSAQNNVEKRVQRHLTKEKKLHWHIDYLLALPQAVIRTVEVRPWRAGAECRWARQTRHEGGRVVIDGFGASDCRNRCGAHLLLMPAGPAD